MRPIRRDTRERAGVSESTSRSAGKNFDQSPTTSTVPIPPKTTAGTVPIRAAITPARNSPSSLEAPMKTDSTALTRPRNSSGVATWISTRRMMTLTMSAPPSSASIASDSHRFVEIPNPIVASPNTATQ